MLFVQSYGEYVKLYTQDDIILALQTTAFMEKLLPSETFVRVHRSSIVNMNHIKEIEGNMIRIEGHQITVSKRMREGFIQKIKAKGMI